jgi:hypothetical protein
MQWRCRCTTLRGTREPKGGVVQIDEVSTRGLTITEGEEETKRPLKWEIIRIKMRDSSFNSVYVTARRLDLGKI